MRITRTALATLAVSALIVATAIPAFAGKPTKYDLAVPDGYYGETVTATASSGLATKSVSDDDATDYTYWRVLAQCHQNGELVFKHYALFDGEYSSFPLGPTRAWQEGDAECTAELGYFHKGSVSRWRVVDATSFAAVWPASTDTTTTGEAVDGDVADSATSAPRDAQFTIL